MSEDGQPRGNWRRKYDGMTPPEMRRLKQLEDKNATLSAPNSAPRTAGDKAFSV